MIFINRNTIRVTVKNPSIKKKGKKAVGKAAIKKKGNITLKLTSGKAVKKFKVTVK